MIEFRRTARKGILKYGGQETAIKILRDEAEGGDSCGHYPGEFWQALMLPGMRHKRK
jgi:hypothetical protein